MEVIIALDSSNENDIAKLLSDFKGLNPYFKVGMELFYFNPKIIENLKKENYKIFLDLKLHDIPNTVFKALNVINSFDIDMTNVHALGGLEMLKKAREAITSKTKLIAVTHLTSSNNDMIEKEIKMKHHLDDSILNLAKLSKTAGLDGVVCSAFEVKMIKENCGKDFLTITPGIRLESDSKDDQQRVATPFMAKNFGSDYIVVGRSITNSKNPRDTYLSIIKDIS